MTKIRAYVRVYGRVQGVFFRAYTREKADELGVTGYVRNLPDGSVEAVIEGDREKVDKLIEWMHQGPPLARVDKVEYKYMDYIGEFKRFEIRY